MKRKLPKTRACLFLEVEQIEAVRDRGESLSPLVRGLLDEHLSKTKQFIDEEIRELDERRKQLLIRKEKEIRVFLEGVIESFEKHYTHDAIQSLDLSVYPEYVSKLLARKKGVTIEDAREEIEGIRSNEEKKALALGYPKRIEEYKEVRDKKDGDYGESDENDYW